MPLFTSLDVGTPLRTWLVPPSPHPPSYTPPGLFQRFIVSAHSSYPSDANRGRNSWAFALEHPEETGHSLPSIPWRFLENIPTRTFCLPHFIPLSVCWCLMIDLEESVSLWKSVTQQVTSLLEIESGRILFNHQQYWQKSLPVLPHRDGEVISSR